MSFAGKGIIFNMWCCKCWVKREMFCIVVVGSVSSISSLTKFDGVWISCFA